MTAPRTPPPLRGYTRGHGLCITWRCDDCGQTRESRLGLKQYCGGRLKRCAECVERRATKKAAE